MYKRQAFNSPIYGPFFMKQGMQCFVDAFNTRAPQASGTDLSPEQQDDAELARYANAARIKNKAKNEELITQLKLSFFTDVSHELRTPLTLITGP